MCMYKLNFKCFYVILFEIDEFVKIFYLFVWFDLKNKRKIKLFCGKKY